MSVEAITWALRQPVKPSSTKFVLVVLANCASGDTFLAYPSIAYLCDATGQDRKTVIGNLEKLREWGLIEDTERRAGATKQVVVYRIKCGPDLFQAVPKMEQSQNRNGSENPGEQYRFSGETVPKTVHGTVNNHQEPKKLSAQPSASRFPEWWAAYPKKVGKKPAEAKWRSKKLDDLADRLIADVIERAANDDGWVRGFVPDPITYLNQERWNDELRTAPVARVPAQQPSKQMQGLMALEDMKRGLVRNRDSDGIAEASVLLLGSDPGR